MFAAGTYAGAGNGEKSILPVLAAALGLLNALLWGYQNITGTEASWFRPDYSLFGTEIRNIGLFGYKIFRPFPVRHRFFLCAYSMASARKWGIRLFTGLALILVSFTCGSRSAFPNALAGVTLCFFIYTSSVFRNNRKFYTASILFIILLFLGTSYAVLDLSRGRAGLPPFWIRFPSATGWTCPNWPGRWRTRLRCSVTEAGCTPIFPRSFLRSQLPQFCPPRIRTNRLRLRLCRAGADAGSAGPVSYFRTPERSEIVRRTSTAQSSGTGGVLRIVHRRFPRLWGIHLA